MVTTSNALLELPKRRAVLVEDRGIRLKARGLFWLTLATVVLSLVVVLASLWKTCATPSVPARSSPVTATNPSPVSPPAMAVVPSPVPEAPIVTQPVELPAEPAEDREVVPPVPPGFPGLNQFP